MQISSFAGVGAPNPHVVQGQLYTESQIIMLYTLNYAVCYLYLNKTRKKIF